MPRVVRSLSLPITESSQVGDARRRATQMAEELGLGQTPVGRLGIIATEAAGNLLKHATRGEILLQAVQRGPVAGIELLALDQGPGIGDIGLSMRDGHSTTGTSGTGLGAISRLADEFQIHSADRSGTAILARVWSEWPLRAPGTLAVGTLSIPMPGEDVCGDGCGMMQVSSARVLIAMIDGLGHGAGAADASRAALRAFAVRATSPAEMIEVLHRALHGTRGAAAAVVDLDVERREVRFAGIGNIAGSIWSAGHAQSMVSHHGIVGHQMRKVQEFAYAWPPDASLILHSDGLSERWDLGRYGGVARRDPSLVAGLLYRDHARHTDDATVLVARESAPA